MVRIFLKQLFHRAPVNDCLYLKQNEVFKNRQSKICGIQPLKGLKWYGLLTLSLPGTRCVGPNTDRHSNSDITKTVRVNIVLTRMFFKVYSISFLIICRWETLFLSFSSYWFLNSVELLESQNLSFSIFLVLKGLNKIMKKKKNSKRFKIS